MKDIRSTVRRVLPVVVGLCSMASPAASLAADPVPRTLVCEFSVQGWGGNYWGGGGCADSSLPVDQTNIVPYGEISMMQDSLSVEPLGFQFWTARSHGFVGINGHWYNVNGEFSQTGAVGTLSITDAYGSPVVSGGGNGAVNGQVQWWQWLGEVTVTITQ